MDDPDHPNSFRIPRRRALGPLSAAALAAGVGWERAGAPAGPAGVARVLAGGAAGRPEARPPEPGHPRGVRPAELTVVDREALTDDQAIMIATLQGLLARRGPGRDAGPAIYLDLPNGYRQWLSDLTGRYGLPAGRTDDPWRLVEQFAERVAGYVLYRSGGPTINCDTTDAGALGGV